MRALIFDSGVGGLSVLDAMVAAGLPLTCDFMADSAWLPYGEKPDAALVERVPRLVQAAAAAFEPDVIVIACNTASTLTLEAVRAAVPMPVVGVVPPVKPAAAASKTGVIGVLATPATISRPYLARLIEEFAPGLAVVRCGSAALVAAAEAKLRGEPQPEGAVEAAIACLFSGEMGAKLDVVALSCTHFPLLRSELAAAAPRAVAWVESGPAIARRVAALLGLEPGAGQVRLGRAAFTAPDARTVKAFAAFGFTAFAELEEAGLTLAPWAPTPAPARA